MHFFIALYSVRTLENFILGFLGGLRPPSESLSGYLSFFPLSRLVGFIGLVIYISLIDDGLPTKTTPFLAGFRILAGRD
jgi:hypothetical protein